MSTIVAPSGVAPDEALLDDAEARMGIVIVGHVDHGKSTVVGRLLADTGTLPDGKLAQIRDLCARTSRPFEWAFLLDALRDERAQGITIDAARVFFRTPRRRYLVLDAPGHVEFLKNMVTGAARAEAALLVLDAAEGVRENTRRHAYLLSLLGVRQLAVLVNKMDLVGDAESAFRALAAELGAFLGEIGLAPAAIVPVVGRDGDNLATRSDRFAWYDGPTVVEALDAFAAEGRPVDKPLRLPVQDVYKFTAAGDDRRIVAGTVESGRLRVGDEVVFHPSGKRARVRSLEAFADAAPDEVAAGETAGFTFEPQLYVRRGEVVARADEPAPRRATRLRASVFWLGARALEPGRDYALKLGTARVLARLERVERVVDASTLAADATRARVLRHEVADCVLRLRQPIAVDLAADLAATSRFVLVDGFAISGGGVVRDVLDDEGGAEADTLVVTLGGETLRLDVTGMGRDDVGAAVAAWLTRRSAR